MPAATFRANVGIVATDGHGRVLLFERAQPAHTWQFPQGGLRRGETVSEGARREWEEETGLPGEGVQIHSEHPRWLTYEIPETRRVKHLGQVQKWVLVVVDPDIRPDPLGATSAEFVAWEWTTPAEALRRSVDFKESIYRDVLDHFAAVIGSPAPTPRPPDRA